MSFLTACQQKEPRLEDRDGYEQGEAYLSIWVHSIENTEEGRAYREAVESFNMQYNGTYFADIEFIPRNDSGGKEYWIWSEKYEAPCGSNPEKGGLGN